MNDRTLSLLGIARRAGKLSLGHDAAIEAIVKNKAKLCIVCSDGSQRLKNEMSHACEYDKKNIMFVEAEFTIQQISNAVGSKAAVLTVNDEGFAKAITK
ncbi:MAG: ribosomal L7Ae/L30e/S12e/Gadd45 family protein [Faecalibacterium sp.]|nr:ribosomal L7Ae/L30e/S12e/Gadd45 family protein [Ruminococcus sp.]MCM1391567.1 ribosomal L7Ae/L30e/S12e/Gadd45 family protein [Ruminococcus sp.]MCM1485124.1 ribosomal L7Ae/L30e/S12e/Gadd45 family protein [Faecalibacterium sp.]